MIRCQQFLRPRNVLGSQVVCARGYAQDFKIRRTMRMPKTVMYNVVGDVAKYNEFVPYCLESTIVEHDKSNVPTTAMLRVGWNQLDEQFESKLEYTANKVRAIAADNKMFKELLCEWTIDEISANQCHIELKLRFEFQNKLYDFMAQSAGTLVAKRMVEAFTKRALSVRP